MKKFKKLFGGINLTWSKLITVSVVIGLFVGFLMTLSFLKDTAFQDIGAIFYWWVLFGVMIIMNSKSNLDSAFKCFVFFLISQPLIYLVQVPFSYMGWGLFGYYRYWFIWTLLTIPMGYVGYFMKKNDLLAAIILLPALAFVAFEGSSAYPLLFDRPDMIVRAVSTIIIILALAFGVLENKTYRIAELLVVAVLTCALAVVSASHNNVSASSEFRSAELGIELSDKWKIETGSDDNFKLDIDGSEIFDENDQSTGEVEYLLKIDWAIIGKKSDEREVSLLNTETNERRICKFYMDKHDFRVVGCKDGKN